MDGRPLHVVPRLKTGQAVPPRFADFPIVIGMYDFRTYGRVNRFPFP